MISVTGQVYDGELLLKSTIALGNLRSDVLNCNRCFPLDTRIN